MRFLSLVLLVIAISPAFAGGFGPWKFGMSSDEIRAVVSNGPYRTFSNGDLETYNASFGGKNQNAQFYIKNGHLWRVALHIYEGTDLVQAAKAWADTYTTLKALHGQLETPHLSGDTLQSLAESAKALVANGGKVQMAPVSQPKSEFVFSSFYGVTSDGPILYMVVVNYDQPAP